MTEADLALLRDLLDRLTLVRKACGARVYRSAMKASRLAIADTILGIAEDRLGLNREGGGQVVPFPKRRRLVRRPLGLK